MTRLGGPQRPLPQPAAEPPRSSWASESNGSLRPADGDGFAHTAISASAGSGKTFQLTNRYLRLAAAGAEPSSVLASTFTRLAAGQIRDKLLWRLAEAARDERRRRELATQLDWGSHTRSPADGSTCPSLTREMVLDLLAALVRRLHLLQIRTLDSFFASVVRSFALELAVPIDWGSDSRSTSSVAGSQVVDEDQAFAMRSQAIQWVLDERQPQRLIELLRLLTQGASDRDIAGTIDRTVAGMYALWRDAPAAAWECVPERPGRLAPPMLVQAIERLEQAERRRDSRWDKAHQQDCERARNWAWQELLGSGLAKAVALGTNTYHNQPIAPDLVAAYTPVVQHAIAELVGRASGQTLAARELLELFHRQYERVKHSRRAVTFDDLTAAMSRIPGPGRLLDLCMRLDARVTHLLLDEFQDTSVAQWRALEPIVREIISTRPPERTFFCVGDVKQCIYAWRDAAPEILDDLPSLLQGSDGSAAVSQRTLARSYRSSPVIMEVVNRVFASLGTNDALQGMAEAAERWSRGFVAHDTARPELAGYVELRLCRPAGPAESRPDLRLRAAAELAAELHSRNTHITIALLTRTNPAVARLLYELGPSRLNLPVSARGGGPLTDAAPVNVILDVLHLADHPDDTVAAFNVAASSMGAVVDLPRHTDVAKRRHVARTIRRELLERGYGPVIAEWVRSLAPSCDGREVRRMRQLIERADAHHLDPGARTCDFIATIERSNVQDIQSAPVQVMTIHQAKGLEFDAVILPELEAPLTGGRHPPAVFEREGETGPITRVCTYVNKQTLELIPELRPLFERHVRRCVRESLSVLYVGMTRAIHGLYMLIDPPQVKKDGELAQRGLRTIAGVVRCALAGESRRQLDPGSQAYAIGDPQWWKSAPAGYRAEPDEIGAAEGRLPTSASAATPVELSRAGKGTPSPAAQRGEAVKSASAAAGRTTLRDLLRLPDYESRDRGSAIHALFEQVEWIEDFDGDDAELAALVRAKVPRRSQRWAAQQVAAFRRMLDTQAAREALAAGLGRKSPASAQLHRELPFARIIDGRLQRGVIDRLVIFSGEDESRAAADVAVLLDIKTDAIAPEVAEGHAELYRAQLDCYRAAVCEQFRLQAAQVGMQVLFVEPGVLVRL